MLKRPSQRTGCTRHAARHARQSAPRRRRLAVTAPGLALITIVTLAALTGCSGSASSGSASSQSEAVAGPADASAPAAPAAASAAAAAGGHVAQGFSSAGGTSQAAAATPLEPTGQQLIYTASLTVRVRSVSAAVARATAIAAGEGGYVASENASSDQNQPDQATATVELKVPVAQYTAALHDLTQPSLGTQLSLQQQTQDVTEQVADVSSRVTSDEAAIVQLRALLKHAGTVGDLLSVQDQINSQESDLEAMLAQQSALNHETSYATVTLTVVGPKAVSKPKPVKHAHTPGLVNGLTDGWHAFRTTVSWLLAIIGAVAPFAVIIALIAGLAYWARRWLTRRGRRAGSSAADSPADS
jgi:hypothetical protein